MIFFGNLDGFNCHNYDSKDKDGIIYCKHVTSDNKFIIITIEITMLDEGSIGRDANGIKRYHDRDNRDDRDERDCNTLY